MPVINNAEVMRRESFYRVLNSLYCVVVDVNLQSPPPHTGRSRQNIARFPGRELVANINDFLSLTKSAK
jgi:hypothetical protein